MQNKTERAKQKEELKEKFGELNRSFKQNYPEASLTVLQFISDFMTHAAATQEECEVLRLTFHAGYCWHFAHILKDTFKRGEVCWAAPFGHFVWVDDNGVPYDVEGVNEGEQDYNIPESYLGDKIKDFTHIPGECVPITTDDEVIEIIRKYEEDHNLPRKQITLYHFDERGTKTYC